MTPLLQRRGARIALAGVSLLLLALCLADPQQAATGAAYLAPAMLVFALVWRGHYPGERLLIARLPAPSRTRAHRMSAPPQFSVCLPRGGRLLAAALAGRAPPPRACSHLSCG